MTGVELDQVPHAVESERAVLYAALTSAQALTEATKLLADDEWYLPAHADIWRVLRELEASHGAVDATAVAVELTRTQRPHVLQALLRVTDAGAVGSLSYHCEQITRTHAARQLLETVRRAEQLTTAGREPVALAEDIIEQLRMVQRMGEPEAHTELDFHDIVARVIDPATFVVPGLLARDNRIVITAPEGYGKSSLLRQIAACAAGGVHPFKLKAVIRPVGALVIDAENPEDVNTIEYRRLHEFLTELDRVPERGRLVVEECGPINVLDSRTAARLSAQVERLRPELIVIGPIYQLHEEDANDERAARKLAAFLDRLRRISRAAVVTEAHTPHSDGPGGQLLRPFGASLWKRWPEFGYCLHPAVKASANPSEEERISLQMRESRFTAWRGPRAQRDWPERMCRGTRMLWETY